MGRLRSGSLVEPEPSLFFRRKNQNQYLFRTGSLVPVRIVGTATGTGSAYETGLGPVSDLELSCSPLELSCNKRKETIKLLK